MSPAVLFPSWLKVFLAVVEQKSFNKAAKVLLVSQPAVSQKMHQLETALDVRLFHRSPDGVQLTAAGEKLLRYAQATRWLLLTAESQLAGAESQESRLILGTTPGISTYRLPTWLHHFHQEHPQILVQLHTATTPRLMKQVASHTMPLAIIEGDLPKETHVTYEVLQEIRFVIVTPAQEPWSSQQHLSLKALDGQPFVTRTEDSQTRRWIDNLLHSKGVQPHIVAELDSPEAIKKAVMTGLGVTLLPTCMLTPKNTQALHLIEIEEETPKRYLKAIWTKDVPLHPLALAFLASLQEEFSVLQRFVQQIEHPEWDTLRTVLTHAAPTL